MNAAPVVQTPSRAAAPVAARDATVPRRVLLAVCGLTVLAVVLRFWRIGHQAYWYDESVTLTLLHHSFTGMLGQLRHAEGTPPLYYCVAWLWTRIFGFSEVGLRSLSAVAGVSVIPMIYGIASRLVSRRAGLVAAALAACNPLLIWYSQEARAYSLLVALGTLSLLAFVRLLSRAPSGRWFAAWAIAASLTLATHYYGVIAVVPQAVWLLWAHRRDPRVWSAVTLVATVGVALLPLALGQRQNAVWIGQLPLGQRLAQIPPQFVLGTGAHDRTWLKLAAAVALLVGAGCLALAADARERRGGLVAGGLAISGAVLALVLVPATDNVITRNLILVLIALMVVVAAGLGARRAGVLGWAAAAVLCAIGIAATVAVGVDWKLQRPDWRGVARAVGAAPPAGAARAVLVGNDPSLIPLGDYMPGLSVMRFTGPPVQELSVVAALEGPTVALCWWGAACHLPLAPLDTSIHIPGFSRSGPVVRVNQFAIYRLRATTPVPLTRRAVEQALRGAGLTSFGLFVQPPAGAT